MFTRGYQLVQDFATTPSDVHPGHTWDAQIRAVRADIPGAPLGFLGRFGLWNLCPKTRK